MHKAYLLLGTNLGDRLINLQRTLQIIEREIGLIASKSSLYETAPWGDEEQGYFINQAIEVNTQLDPLELLKITQSIEFEIGRKPSSKWGPRQIDIDVLFYDDLILSTAKLTIPHPEIANRQFTLVPLNEIAPDYMHLVTGKTINQLLLECKDELQVTKLELLNEI